jgi:RNA polymerase sigma-70 factor (ECF subfamily)
VPLWFQGRDDYGRFMQRVFRMRPAGWSAVPLTANGQPALACYHAEPASGVRRAHSLQVFAVEQGLVTACVAFADSLLFEVFGLPGEVPGD